ncbi:DUF899-domain-containing protein [Glonium stellatum]|uniref:DUF899-domain-containing protein n=1 Tax=Glonium stellatum TaxID=574774 RepID=A0A8E2FDX7_9PEZI|nr:DUF899-domain-containing protein [Glonium stellatum]
MAQAATSTPTPDPAFLKWPASASPEYIEARRALLDEEFALRNQIERVAAQRRALPPGPILPKYVFEEGPADLTLNEPSREICLGEVAGAGGKTLVLYHMMLGENAEEACPACSMFLDGLNGVAKHLAQYITFVVVAKAPLEKVRAWARKRGWVNLRLLSSCRSEFNKDMGVERPAWFSELEQGPGISVFRYEVEEGKPKEEGVMRHFYTTTPHFAEDVVRGMDLLSPVWNLLDLTPEGRGEWNPRNDTV